MPDGLRFRTFPGMRVTDPILDPWAIPRPEPEARAGRFSSDDAMLLAIGLHRRAFDRYGSPLLPHVARVATSVPFDARSVAWLHEALETSSLTADDLADAGVGAGELAAIELLTRDKSGDEADYLAHVALIAYAPGASGSLARLVKRADLIDRMTHMVTGSGIPAPPPHRRALALLSDLCRGS